MFAATCNREKALKFSNASRRSMERMVCCKSQFKFKCFSCGEWVNRGDKITVCHNTTGGMTLRQRGAGGPTSRLTWEESAFYQPTTGTKRWVHAGCNPCSWSQEHGDTRSPSLVGIWTEWSAKIKDEFDEDYVKYGHWDMEDFLEHRMYPRERFMKKRIIKGVIKFQNLWRSYIYKKALAIEQQDDEGDMFLLDY